MQALLRRQGKSSSGLVVTSVLRDKAFHTRQVLLLPQPPPRMRAELSSSFRRVDLTCRVFDIHSTLFEHHTTRSFSGVTSAAILRAAPERSSLSPPSLRDSTASTNPRGDRRPPDIGLCVFGQKRLNSETHCSTLKRPGVVGFRRQAERTLQNRPSEKQHHGRHDQGPPS